MDDPRAPGVSASLRKLVEATGIPLAVWMKKRDDMRRTHAKSIGVSTQQLRDWGWVNDRMLRDLVHAWFGDCPGIYCGHVPMSELPLGSLTVDIRDVSQPAIWGLNTGFMCRLCNGTKYRKTVEAMFDEAIRLLAPPCEPPAPTETYTQRTIFDPEPGAPPSFF